MSKRCIKNNAHRSMQDRLLHISYLIYPGKKVIRMVSWSCLKFFRLLVNKISQSSWLKFSVVGQWDNNILLVNIFRLLVNRISQSSLTLCGQVDARIHQFLNM